MDLATVDHQLNGHHILTRAEKEKEECLNVQRTNDESCVSKRSAAKLGYFEDEFLRYFVRKPSRRCPLINRGYYARMMVVRAIQQSFLSQEEPQQRQMLSLGAGFDTSYFHWASKGKAGQCTFFEVDYPTLVERKKTLILEQEHLKAELRGTIRTSSGTLLSDQYCLFGCDLRYPDKLHALLQEHGFDFTAPTMVLAECFLQYLLPEDSDALISWVRTNIPHSMFVAFEQMEGGDAFGGVMQQNLRQKNSPLYGIEVYNTVEDQGKRYRRIGFNQVQVIDLHYWYDHFLGAEECLRVNAIEPFDEWEEWRVTCSHYCAVLAVNFEEDVAQFGCVQYVAEQSLRKTGCVLPTKEIEVPWNWRPEVESTLFNGWGHTCCAWQAGHAVVIFGGFYSGGRGAAAATRTNQVLLYRAQEKGAQALACHGDIPSPRMFHAACMMGTDTMMVFGGRTNPTCGLGDLHTLHLQQREWSAPQLLGPNVPSPRWRHSLTALPNGVALLFGGRTASKHDPPVTLNDTWLLVCEGDHFVRWIPLNLANGPSPRCAHVALAVNGNTVFMHGGLDQHNNVLDDTWLLTIDTTGYHGSWQQVPTPGPRLFAHTATLLDGSVLVVGGLSNCVTASTAHHFSIESQSWTTMPLPPPPITGRSPASPLFTKHQAVRIGNQIMLIGGGAICFSFGTTYTPTYWLQWGQQSDTAEDRVDMAVDVPSVDVQHASLTNGIITAPQSIQHIHNSTESDWLQVVANRVPALFVNCDLGPCISQWTVEYLAEKQGATQVSVHQCQGTHKLDFLKKNFQLVPMSFADLVQATLTEGTGQRLYFRSVGVHQAPSDLAQVFPAIANDFTVPTIMQGVVNANTIHQSVLRVSSPNIHMWMHFDIMDNILCQVRGSKRVVLFPPSEVRNVYVKGSVSQVMDIDEAHQPAFPLFAAAQASRIEITMNEGDVLFLPALWLHSTVAKTSSISINVFFRHLSEDHYDRKDIYGNKDLLIAQKAKQEAMKLRETIQHIPHYYRDFYKQQILQMLEDA